MTFAVKCGMKTLSLTQDPENKVAMLSAPLYNSTDMGNGLKTFLYALCINFYTVSKF
jgi:hypothetical protein